jgi:hypothetical protein
MGPRSGRDAVAKRKNPCTCRKSNPYRPACSPYYTDSCPGSCFSSCRTNEILVYTYAKFNFGSYEPNITSPLQRSKNDSINISVYAWRLCLCMSARPNVNSETIFARLFELHIPADRLIFIFLIFSASSDTNIVVM